MPEIIKWGILGCGHIANKFASDLALVKEAKLIAVASRSRETADKFAAKFNAEYKYNSYQELAANAEVDVIYIAVPHNLHHENTLLCLKNNKAVLCEKPFAMNLKQATKMIDLAVKQKVFLMEALWTKFLPHFIKTIKLIKDGELGDIKSVLINFGFKPMQPVPTRLFDPLLGGGTIMDIGVYNIFMALNILGKPDSIEAIMTPSATGVDEQCSVLFKYSNGAMAQLFSTFKANLPTEADICGTKGSIKLTSRFYEPSSTIKFYKERIGDSEIIPVEKEGGFGYQYEARHVSQCLQNNLNESPVMTFADTLKLTGIMDEVRKAAGIRYATDNLYS